MVKIRLARHGAKNAPFYRIVAIVSTRKRGGKPLEILGHWNPKSGETKIKRKNLNKWLSEGAVMSEKVRKLVS